MSAFPLEPLAAAAGIVLGQIGGHVAGQHVSGNARLAELVGVTPRRMRQLRHQGLTEEQADRAACAIGLHPMQVWPEWVDDGISWANAMAELEEIEAWERRCSVVSLLVTRALVRAMTVDQFAEREAEIYRWLGAGAIDGETAPEIKRPDGHDFTLEEISSMTPDEYDVNEPAILQWTQARGQRLKAERMNAPVGKGQS